MRGFFYSEGTTPKRIHKVQGAPLTCEFCGLFKGCQSPKMGFSGGGGRGVLVVAEAPGRTEDERGTQLVGEAGQLLRDTLAGMGVDLDRDCWKTNSVQCRPPDNREPTDHEVECCRARVWAEIARLKPKIILLLGNVALRSFLGHRWRKDLGGITRWRGWRIPDRGANAWVCPTFHPSFVLRSRGDPIVASTFTADLKAALLRDAGSPTWHNRMDEEDDSAVSVVTVPGTAVAYLNDLINVDKPELVAIDYETTGKKPHKKGHDIVSAAVAWSARGMDRCMSFSMSEPVVRKAFSRLLTNPNIGKVAHGFKFEELWSRIALGTEVSPWAWCTQTAAHVLDSRKDVYWLKFLVYTHFGRVDYDSEIEAYLGSIDPDDGNSFNRVREAPLKSLLLYNGLDALYTLRLARTQMAAKPRGYSLLHEGGACLSDIEANGIRVDEGYCKRQAKRITAQVDKLKAGLDNDPAVKHWRARYPKDKFNLFSPVQLKDVLFNHLGLKSTATTAKGNPSISADTLEDFADKAPFVGSLVRIRKLSKARDTFLEGLARESVGGVMHPFFKLHNVETFRSSSANPNFQNFPKRDPELERIVRQAIVPRPGRRLLEVDYKNIEVKVAACYTHDPVLMRYVTDPNTDMHRDMAMELFILSRGEVSKDIRQAAKGGFVFPEFYGSYWVNVAPAMWRDMQRGGYKLAGSNITVADHLAAKGISKLGDPPRQGEGHKAWAARSGGTFMLHVSQVESRFWNDRFRVYTDWKEKWVEQYRAKGYMDTLTRFRLRGPLDKKQICNWPIQGSAFHCLLWSLTRLCQIAREERWKSLWVGQIHDSAICDVVPDELNHVLETTRRVMTQDIVRHWPWITVPLDIEAEVTEIDGSWYTKEKIGQLKGDLP